MIYVFDSSAFIDLFGHYYRSRFPTLWEKFDQLVNEGAIISVREVYGEISDYGDGLSEWAKSRQNLFQALSSEESGFVSDIFKVPKYQALVPVKRRLVGKPVADPFLIAKARMLKGCVVTSESSMPDAVRIPAVCKHFGVRCLNLEGFMAAENWMF